MKHLMFLNLGIVTTVDYYSPQNETKPTKKDTVLYSMNPRDLEGLLGLENITVAIKGSADALPTYQCGGIWYKPLESQFGLDLENFQKAYELEEEIATLGYEATSAGNLARELLEKCIKKTYGRMPEGLQKEAHSHFSNLFQGPMVLCRTGEVEMATYLDQDRAYLQAMLEPLPEFGRYPMRADSAPTPEEILDGVWSVEGTFDTRYDYLPSLQKRTYRGNVWLNDSCHTKVAGNHLKYLLENYKLTKEPAINVAYQYDMENVPSRCMTLIHREISKMSKSLAKRVYTRLIGGMAHYRSYRYDGNVKELYAMSEAGKLNDLGMAKADSLVFLSNSDLPYRVEDIRDYERIPPTYRPDIAWLIWERCTAETLRVCQKFGSNLLASHIDSCVVAGNVEPEKGWSVKAKGRYLGFGVGNYICGDHTSCSGFDPNERTLEEHFNLVGKDDGRSWPVTIKLGRTKETDVVQYTSDFSKPFDGADMPAKDFEVANGVCVKNATVISVDGTDKRITSEKDVSFLKITTKGKERFHGIFDFTEKGNKGTSLVDGRQSTFDASMFMPGRYHIEYSVNHIENQSGSKERLMSQSLTPWSIVKS